MTVAPQTTLDLQSILCGKLEMDAKEFERKFDVEQQDDKLILKIRRDQGGKYVWLGPTTLSGVREYIQELGGSWVPRERQWEIPTAKSETPPQPQAKLPKRFTPPQEPTQLPNAGSSSMPAFAEGGMTLEELKVSESEIGQIFPVIKDQHGNILDGYHRKRIDPDWKETVVDIADPLHGLRIRVHANTLRRNVPWEEKHGWVMDARKLLSPDEPMSVSQEEVAKALGMSRRWVSKHDKVLHESVNLAHRANVETEFYGYNVWGFKNSDWRNFIVSADSDQPDKEFYHGITPAYVIRQLIQMFQPKTVLDSMAGVGTTGYICKQEGIECDQFDVYPYPKYGVMEADAEFIDTDKKYDLIFNHIPYFQMVKYGDKPNDLSTLNKTEFFAKLERIFKKNFGLLTENGIYAVLVGDWRHENQIIPLMAHVTMLGLTTGFVLYDEAVKLTAEQKGQQLQEYRAAKFGYLAQTFDMVLIFRKASK